MNEPTRSEKRVLIEVEGDLLGLSALSLPDRLPLATLGQAEHVLLSMENVRHMDQAGLAMLVRLYSQLRVRGRELQLLHVQAPVLKTLERVGLGGLVWSSRPPEPKLEGAPRQGAHESVVHDAQPET